MISKEDLFKYKKYCNEKLDGTHSIQVLDVVKISKNIAHDVGHYENEYGIVYNLTTGLDNCCTVVAYDHKLNRYWACEFEEKDLTLIKDLDIYFDKNLYEAFEWWVLHNSGWDGRTKYINQNDRTRKMIHECISEIESLLKSIKLDLDKIK